MVIYVGVNRHSFIIPYDFHGGYLTIRVSLLSWHIPLQLFEFQIWVSEDGMLSSVTLS